MVLRVEVPKRELRLERRDFKKREVTSIVAYKYAESCENTKIRVFVHCPGNCLKSLFFQDKDIL